MEPSISEEHDVFYYISSLANPYTPAKTIYVCAPDKYAASYETIVPFATNSGWIELAEKDGAVLVMPLAEHGWSNEEFSMIPDIYNETRQKFKSKTGESIPGREGFLWCWETLVYLVGYEEGAVYAGNVTVAYPNRFAGVALINGVPDNYEAGTASSDHWLVREVSSDYQMTNQEIPVCLWMFANNEALTKEAVTYFSKINQISTSFIHSEYADIATKLYENTEEEAWQIRVSVGDFSTTPRLAKTIFHEFFEKFIRWKNSPDGTLKPHLCKTDFYRSEYYDHASVTVNNITYDYHTYLPGGKYRKVAAELPVVFSVHGRGEPAWIFSTKNGWERLAEETGEFLVVLPDSPQNMWFFDRDHEVYGAIIDRLSRDYAIDRSRVYLTGFSNGGMMTRWMGIHHPELFAAISSWNAPTFIAPPVNTPYAESFDEILAAGYEQPCLIYVGDKDEKVPLWEDTDNFLLHMLQVNHCSIQPVDPRNPMKYQPDEVLDQNNYYTMENHYTDGDRFHTFLYHNQEGHGRVALSLMKNMPHGAVYDQSRAAWEFLKQFRRPEGSKSVIVI